MEFKFNLKKTMIISLCIIIGGFTSIAQQDNTHQLNSHKRKTLNQAMDDRGLHKSFFINPIQDSDGDGIADAKSCTDDTLIQQTYLQDNRNNIYSIDVTATNPNPIYLCRYDGTTFGDIAIDQQENLYGISLNEHDNRNSKIYRLDRNCNKTFIKEHPEYGGNGLSIIPGNRLLAGQNSSSNVYVYTNLGKDSAQLWHHFERGSSAGDFIYLNNKIYISWVLQNSNHLDYRLYEVTIDDHYNYVSHIDLGRLPARTYGLSIHDKILYASANDAPAINGEFKARIHRINLNNNGGFTTTIIFEATTVSFEYNTHIANLSLFINGATSINESTQGICTNDLDDDNDGILDIVENGGINPDTNGLGNDLDTDGDGIPNYLDLDSDNDGCFDVIEAGFSDIDNDGRLGSSPIAIDDNGKVININGYTTPLDHNSNSIPDYLEVTHLEFIQTSLPQDITVSCGNIPEVINLTASNNIPVLFNETQIGSSNNCAIITRVWFTEIDLCGNSLYHSQTINVEDTTAPIFNEPLPQDIVVLSTNIPIATILTATDNCNEVTVLFSESIIDNTCNYTINRTWTATDYCGNTTTHTQIIQVAVFESSNTNKESIPQNTLESSKKPIDIVPPITLSSENTISHISLHPNPTKGIIKISGIKDFKRIRIAITNFLGQKIMTNKRKNEIDIRLYPNGIYFVSIEDDNGNKIDTKRIVKY